MTQVVYSAELYEPIAPPPMIIQAAQVLRNQMTPLIIDSRVVIFRNILTPGHTVRVRG